MTKTRAFMCASTVFTSLVAMMWGMQGEPGLMSCFIVLASINAYCAAITE